MEKSIKNIVVEEKLEEWVVWFLIILATAQIGLSRVYIDAIAYTYNSMVGIYLFGFTLSNMMYLFIIFSVKENVKKFSVSLIVALGAILYFCSMILKIFNEELNVLKVLRLNDILKPSIYLVLGVGLLVLGTLTMFIINKRTTRGIR